MKSDIPRLPLVFACGLVTLLACINHYDPCAGKATGDACRRCDPDDSSCVETSEVKTCSPSGGCVAPRSTSSADAEKKNDGHAWLVDKGGGFCQSWIGVTDSPRGGLWLGTGGGLFEIEAATLDARFRAGERPIEPFNVMAMKRIGADVFVQLGLDEVVRFGPDGERVSLGAGTSKPFAASDNGCIGVRLKDELAVMLPGATTSQPAPLPRPGDGLRLEVDAAVGLARSLLVRTYRSADGTLGALYDLACPSLAVTELAKGDGVVNLTAFTRAEGRRVWAVDRYNGMKSINYRLMRSEDDGRSWSAVDVPAGFQSSHIAVRGKWVVVVPPRLQAILWSNDAGERWTLEPLDTYVPMAELDAMSVHVSEQGAVTIGGNCNYLIHRRAPLPPG